MRTLREPDLRVYLAERIEERVCGVAVVQRKLEAPTVAHPNYSPRDAIGRSPQEVVDSLDLARIDREVPFAMKWVCLRKRILRQADFEGARIPKEPDEKKKEEHLDGGHDADEEPERRLMLRLAASEIEEHPEPSGEREHREADGARRLEARMAVNIEHGDAPFRLSLLFWACVV